MSVLVSSIGLLSRTIASIAASRGNANTMPAVVQFGREKFTTQLERRRMCQALQGTLEMLGARQLVVGHTPQVCAPAYLLVPQYAVFRPTQHAVGPWTGQLDLACKPAGLTVAGCQTLSPSVTCSKMLGVGLVLCIRTWYDSLIGPFGSWAAPTASATAACGEWMLACPQASSTPSRRCARQSTSTCSCVCTVKSCACDKM